jgi:hypothetical protein
MPELGQVSDGIAAALIGVAPYDDDSGKRRGEIAEVCLKPAWLFEM